MLTLHLLRSMLAIMTMNIGYFFSVLAGAFIGAFSMATLAAT